MQTFDKRSIDWVAVDWGTTHVRAWALSDECKVIAKAESNLGMSSVAQGGFEAALLDIIGEWLSDDRVINVIACGMVGAKQGWMEAAYDVVPCAPVGNKTPLKPAVNDPRISAHILHGLCQKSPADVMRGEETQIAGLIASDPDFSGVVCLPGTHTKWVVVSDGAVQGFKTFMTGELFSIIENNSILQHSIQSESWDEVAFKQAFEMSMENPQLLAANLFSIRAKGLVDDLKPEAARAMLSGYLLGLELAATKQYWANQSVAIIAASNLSNVYRDMLQVCCVKPIQLDAEKMTLAGLAAAYKSLIEKSEGA